MPVEVRIVFINDIGVAGTEEAVLMEELPSIGTIISGPESNDLPDSEVLHVFMEKAPDDMLELFGPLYDEFGYDGLPLVVCELPEGWRPTDSYKHMIH